MMKNRHSLVVLTTMAVAATICIIAAGCVVGSTLTIDEINNAPDNYSGKNVTIGGKVLESWSIMLGDSALGIYNITDTTGSMVIVSSGKIAPTNGSFVIVHGDVRNNVLMCAGRPVCVWQAP